MIRILVIFFFLLATPSQGQADEAASSGTKHTGLLHRLLHGSDKESQAQPDSRKPKKKDEDVMKSLQYKGMERQYLVHLPPQYKPGASLPVVLVFHGGGGSAKGAPGSTGMDQVSDAHGFIAVYPEGTSHTWNAGGCCGGAMKHKVNDVGFVSSLIDTLVADYHIDAKRVYATGISNGSQMSYRLSCELSEKIAAIAPVAGQSVFKDCHPTRAVAVWHFHGTADPCCPYNGGDKCGGCWGTLIPGIGATWPCDPVESQIAQTAARNGCSAKTQTVMTKGQVTCSTFQGCPAGDDVTLCKIVDGGHTWPGGEWPSLCDKPDGYFCRKYKEAVGPINNDISASELMWQFFSRHHL